MKSLKLKNIASAMKSSLKRLNSRMLMTEEIQ